MSNNRIPNNDEVICPKCVHQFRAIPVNVQAEISALQTAARKLIYAAETSGGIGGRDEFLCDAIVAVRKLLPEPPK